jgi:D-alanyl-D-alanine carboxypeptidase/D-alanyl-D-alanine-endopeptidase (penicillin-binding protein 4)
MGLAKKRLIALVIALGMQSAWTPASAQDQRDRVIEPARPITTLSLPDTRLPSAARPSVRPSGSPATVAELQSRISEVTHRPGLARAQIGVKIASLDSGQVLFEENADKLYMPASNMKIYTVAAALDKLSPDFRFVTSVYAPAKPEADGLIKGDLTVYGRGDPSFSATFNNGDYWKAINDLAQKIADSGLRRVDGDLVGDESYFRGPPFGAGWEWDDLQTYDGAPISALSVNNNAVDVFVRSGGGVGSSCSVSTGPSIPSVSIANRAVMGPPGSRRDISIVRDVGSNVIEVSGTLPVGDQGISGIISVPDPALAFVYMLRSALIQRGVTVTGRTRTITAKQRGNVPFNASNLVELTKVLSPPLSEIAAKTLKPSQNLYTEMILRALGQIAGPTADQNIRTSSDAGHEVVKQFVATAGLDPNSYALADGSGLSRHNLISASGTLQLLIFMSRHRYANVFRDALPVAGIDGTLRNRLKDNATQGNIHAKTGTINQVASLSGYVTSAAGERLVFSIIVNNLPQEANVRRSYIDEIATMLASFTGKSVPVTVPATTR